MEEKKDDISALTSAIEDKLRVFEETIDGKLASHTAQILELVQDRRIRSSDDDPPRDSANHGLGRRGRPRSPSPTLTFGATGTTQDIQSEFQCLKDSLAKQKLPSELKLNESRQGIQRADQGVYAVLSKCARFAETSIKLLSTIEPGCLVTPELLEELFLVNTAQIKYLQDEYASILVNSQFDTSTSKLFRALQKNTSGLNAGSLETLRSAATIAAAAKPQQARDSRPHTGYGSRGNYRGGYRGGHSGRQDVFDRFSRRSFNNRGRRTDEASPDRDTTNVQS